MADITCWGKSHHQQTFYVVVVLDVWVYVFDVLEVILLELIYYLKNCVYT